MTRHHGNRITWLRLLMTDSSSRHSTPIETQPCHCRLNVLSFEQFEFFSHTHNNAIFSARKRSYGKVTFFHLFVILFTGGLCSWRASAQEGLCRGWFLSGRTPRMVKSGQYASYWNEFLFFNPIYLQFSSFLHHIVLVSAKLDSGRYDYISGFQTSVVQLIFNDASKTLLAILAFFYCGEFVKNPIVSFRMLCECWNFCKKKNWMVNF